MKNTKKALLLSVMSLVLCVSMLVGTTFAWFTDSVSTGKNIIAAGNLDVEMYYADKLETAAADWKDASDGAIFNYQLWEPGYTEVKYITIANEGSLALKYRLDVIPTVPAVPGEVNLGDVIDVYFIDGPAASAADFADVQANWTKVGALSGLMDMTDGTATGILLPENGSANYTGPDAPKGSVTVGIALHMQESAGNEYMNKTVTDGFTVKLLATQLNWENDSFDNTYDESLELLEDGDMLTEENGIQYIRHANGDITLYYVTSAYTDEELIIPEGVTALGNGSIGSAASPYVKKVVVPSTVKSLGTAFQKNKNVETVVLPEGITEIPDKCFNQATALKEVNIPSTVKKIGFNAFRMIASEELVVPATVEELAEGVFRDMPNLKKVTLEGNILIGNFAFRSCNQLETVVLNGADVRFAGTSQAFTRADNGASSNITVYVKNDVIKNRVIAAQGAAYSYTVLVVAGMNETAAGSGVYTDGTNYYAYDNTGLDNAIKANVPVTLGAGLYVVPDSAQGKTLTIRGTGNPEDTVIATQDDGSYEGCDYSLDGATVVFENITINTDSSTYTGYARLKATYNNCIINGTYTLYDASVFNNCTFNVSGDVYNIWTWGATTAEFNTCTFNTSGKAILLYGGANTKLTVDTCVFNDDNAFDNVKNKAAIEVGTDWTSDTKEIVATNCTVNGFDVTDKGINTGSTLWGNKNSMNKDRLNVVIDGVDVY